MSEPARETEYATRSDLEVLRAEVRADMAEFESRLTERTAALEVRTMRTLYAVAAAVLAGQAASVFALLRLLG